MKRSDPPTRSEPDSGSSGHGLLVCRGGESYGWSMAFEVVELPEGPALEVPEILTTQRERSDTDWGTTQGIDVRWSAVDGSTHYELEVSEDPGFASVSRVFAASREEAFLGDDLCGSNVVDYDHQSRHYLRVRAVDIDGDASEWSEVRVVAGAPVLNPLGCLVSPGVPVGVGLVLALGLGLFGIRRR